MKNAAHGENLLFPYPWLLAPTFPEEMPGNSESVDLAVGEMKDNN